MRRDRRGFTLVEVLVILALLGLMAGVTGFALASLGPTRESEALADLQAVRAEAIKTGRPTAAPGGRLFLSDGSARGAGLDLLTGMPHAQP